MITFSFVNVQIPKSHLYAMIIAAGSVIFAASLEVLTVVKDAELYASWLAEIGSSGADLFDDYVSVHLNRYFLTIVVPVAAALYTYFAYTKFRMNRIFSIVWGILIIGGFAYTAAGMSLSSVYSYLYIGGYFAMFVTNSALAQKIREETL